MEDKEELIRDLELQLEELISHEDYDKNKARGLRVKITRLKKGLTCPMYNDECKIKQRQTKIERYGTANVSGYGSEIYLKRFEEKYGTRGSWGNEKLREKYKETMKKKHQVDNPSKSASIRRKTKMTVIEKYRVSNVSKSPIIKRKKEETRRKHK